MLPNFLHIGAAKSASTWLYRVCLEHPDIFVPPDADNVNFFLSTYHRGLNWYEETSINLSSYAGDIVYLRFVWEFPGGSYYDGATYGQVGFFIDDFFIDDGYIGGSWTTVDNNITSTSKTVTLTETGDHCYRVRANWDSQWWLWSDIENIYVEGLIPVEMTAFNASCLNGAVQLQWITQSETENL